MVLTIINSVYWLFFHYAFVANSQGHNLCFVCPLGYMPSLKFYSYSALRCTGPKGFDFCRIFLKKETVGLSLQARWLVWLSSTVFEQLQMVEVLCSHSLLVYCFYQIFWCSFFWTFFAKVLFDVWTYTGNWNLVNIW